MAKKHTFEPARGLFITGTDTDVGKTVVTGAIAAALVGRGVKPGVFKPIATGCRTTREGLVSQDAEFLSRCADSDLLLSQINPICYHDPVTPSVAIERTKREIDWQAMHLAYTNVRKSSDAMIVEGIGGLMVPLEEDYLLLDLMVDMGLPVVIVAPSRLGTINHTLMTLEICRSRQLRVVGIVLNGYRPETAGIAEETNPRVITEFGNIPMLAVIPYDKSTSVEKGVLGPDVAAAAAALDWREVIGGKWGSLPPSRRQ
jgi:dethiobiotin synthetase